MGGNISVIDENGDSRVTPCAVNKQFEGKSAISDLISKKNPTILIKNDCIFVAGNQLLQTFDFLEVAGYRAKSLVMCASIGKMVPINSQ